MPVWKNEVDGPVNSSLPETRESAMQLLVGSKLLRPGRHLLENRWGGRVIWGVQPSEPYDPLTTPELGEM